MKNTNTINCPSCNEQIDVNDVLFHQIKKNLEREFRKREDDRENQLTKIRAELAQQQENQDRKVEELLEARLKSEKCSIEDNIRKRLEEESSVQLTELKRELESKSNKLQELTKTKIENERLKREKDELRSEVELEKELEFSAKIKDESRRIRENLEADYLFKLKEKDKQLDDQKKLAEEMKRKVEQGSVQLQGEVQELELENLLRELYVFDEIDEVKKGQRGADVIQSVRNQRGKKCGRIYYESKRTKHFSDGWIIKLREDNQTMKADILVIVTETMPDGCDNFLEMDGVWICSFRHIKSLSLVLRHGIMNVHEKFQHHQGKETKSEMLYGYLTSQEFKFHFESIIGGFQQIQETNQKEKLKIQKFYTEREKQLDRILVNATDFYGSLRGIAGNAIPAIATFESIDEDMRLLSEIALDA